MLFYGNPEHFWADIVLADNSLVPFKYFKMDRRDLGRANLLQYIDATKLTVTIGTSSNYEFNNHTKIKIDNKQYTVDSIYTAENENQNGPFRKSMPAIIYLILVRFK